MIAIRRSAALRGAAPVLMALAFAAAAPSVWAAEPAEILREIRRSYEATRDLQARFVQESHLAAAGMERVLEGTVAFRKGGRMRWSYDGDDPQLIVSDGKTLWIHQVRDRTVLRQDLEGLPASSRLALDLLSGFEGVEKAFEVSSCGERCLVLTPREPRPDLLRVLVEVGESLGDVVAVTTEDSLGNRTRVELKDVRRNEGVPDETFSFRPPEGAQVLEMGAGEGGGR